MATEVSIAITRDKAVASLKETSPVIAAMLNIEPPDLSFFFRDKNYQQAQELKAMAEFNQRVQTALEGMNNDTTSQTEAAAAHGLDRAVVQGRGRSTSNRRTT